MPLQIFVEDELSEAYEALAQRGLGLSTAQNRRELRAARIEIGDLISFAGLLDLTERSHRAGYDCIIFILDQESALNAPERAAQLSAFAAAFEALCQHLNRLPTKDALRRVKVTRIVSQRCLENWLLSDPQAIVDAMRKGRGVNYASRSANTEQLTPAQASEQIAHHIRQVGQQMGRRDLQQTRANSVKRLGKQIAERVDPQRARPFNRSLAYFFEMVQCVTSGCDKPFPI